MTIKELQIKGVFEITLSPKYDNRGFFMRTYDEITFNKFGIHKAWVQENHSKSDIKGIVRGLHFQEPPFAETKLIRCIRGSIFDVVVDVRKDSETLGNWVSVELSEENMKMLLVPRGFAHGFCTLTDNCEVIYKVDNFYSPEHERGVLWNDPDLDISWPVSDPVLSEKDKKNSILSEYLAK